MRRFILFLSFFPVLVFGQEKSTTLNTMADYFNGHWVSHQADCIGFGKGTRTYGWILDSTFIHIRNQSETPSNDPDKPPSLHYDWGFLSYDSMRDKIVFREFNNESYVNQYTLDSISMDMKKFVFHSEALENVPPGWKARVTLVINDENNFTEYFELATSGKDFKTYVKGVWRRIEEY